ncbi:MAG: PEGA domain-containing protein, partial [Spirochaetaceae bacterium]|nr:PEGA domain-containing protein [Spirochaetaceae bacterium]
MAFSNDQITITEYEHEDYYRHPRMEEEDRLRGKIFRFQPGLEIISNIDDAEIEFFEEKIGRTPWEQDNLKPGAYRVQLERTGYEVLEFWVSVRSDRRTVVLVNMGVPTGTLVLNDLPTGAVVTIDRVPVEGNKVSAAAGTRVLKVSAFGWETIQSDVEIISGGSIEWRYEGTRAAFSLGELKIRPRVLPPGDKRGFTIEWSAVSGGSADIGIFNPDGNHITTIPFAISSSEGTVYWVPSVESESLSEGKYQVVLSGTGYDSSSDTVESFLNLDSRFIREARPAFAPLPGLLYAPGTAMLPRGIWQASTGAGFHIGGGVPVNIGLRFSPVSRFEFTGKFKLTARDPFDATSIGMDFSGSWRVNPKSGPFTLNLALLFSYEGYAVDFGQIPSSNPGTNLPGLQFSLPMEYKLGNWNLVLSPSVQLAFMGNDADNWQFSGPARVTESIGAG